ncbi:MAG: GGDEF domain-containing protein [Spirochaetes bacterium]|nr:GGDEF domain-containing protein [Spirochaetota bacterium]MBN2772312.1 GGDEF domain-containing protein [Spirochaetota bacterium]
MKISFSIKHKHHKSRDKLFLRKLIQSTVIYSVLLILFLGITEAGIFINIHKSTLERLNRAQSFALRTAHSQLMSSIRRIDFEIGMVSAALSSNGFYSGKSLHSSFSRAFFNFMVNDRGFYHKILLYDKNGKKLMAFEPDTRKSSDSKTVSDYAFERPNLLFRHDIIANDNKVAGTIMVVVPFSMIMNSLDSVNRTENGDIYIVDTRGELIYSSGMSGEKKKVMKTVDYFFSEYGKNDIMDNNEDISSFNNRAGFFHFTSIDPVKTNNSHVSFVKNPEPYLFNPDKYPVDSSKLLLFYHLPPALANKADELLVKALLLGAIVLTPFLVLLAFFLAKGRVRNHYYLLELKESATIDKLTGLFNHRYMDGQLYSQSKMALRRGSKLTLAYIDVNDLKLTNDRYGHAEGDQILIGAARAFTASIRSTDIAGRIGGDEFLIIFPDCTLQRAELIMERITENFKSLGFKHNNQAWTLSYGCSEWLGEKDTVQNLLSRADSVMYNNKKMHKNS